MIPIVTRDSPFITIIMMFGYRYTGKRRTLVGVATGSLDGAMSELFWRARLSSLRHIST